MYVFTIDTAKAMAQEGRFSKYFTDAEILLLMGTEETKIPVLVNSKNEVVVDVTKITDKVLGLETEYRVKKKGETDYGVKREQTELFAIAQEVKTEDVVRMKIKTSNTDKSPAAKRVIKTAFTEVKATIRTPKQFVGSLDPKFSYNPKPNDNFTYADEENRIWAERVFRLSIAVNVILFRGKVYFVRSIMDNSGYSDRLDKLAADVIVENLSGPRTEKSLFDAMTSMVEKMYFFYDLSKPDKAFGNFKNSAFSQLNRQTRTLYAVFCAKQILTFDARKRFWDEIDRVYTKLAENRCVDKIKALLAKFRQFFQSETIYRLFSYYLSNTSADYADAIGANLFAGRQDGPPAAPPLPPLPGGQGGNNNAVAQPRGRKKIQFDAIKTDRGFEGATVLEHAAMLMVKREFEDSAFDADGNRMSIDNAPELKISQYAAQVARQFAIQITESQIEDARRELRNLDGYDIAPKIANAVLSDLRDTIKDAYSIEDTVDFRQCRLYFSEKVDTILRETREVLGEFVALFDQNPPGAGDIRRLCEMRQSGQRELFEHLIQIVKKTIVPINSIENKLKTSMTVWRRMNPRIPLATNYH